MGRIDIELSQNEDLVVKETRKKLYKYDCVIGADEKKYIFVKYGSSDILPVFSERKIGAIFNFSQLRNIFFIPNPLMIFAVKKKGQVKYSEQTNVLNEKRVLPTGSKFIATFDFEIDSSQAKELCKTNEESVKHGFILAKIKTLFLNHVDHFLADFEDDESYKNKTVKNINRFLLDKKFSNKVKEIMNQEETFSKYFTITYIGVHFDETEEESIVSKEVAEIDYTRKTRGQ